MRASCTRRGSECLVMKGGKGVFPENSDKALVHVATAGMLTNESYVQGVCDGTFGTVVFDELHQYDIDTLTLWTALVRDGVARRKNKQFGPMTVQRVVTEGATTYLLHELQRGHAQDLADRGSTLRVILEAG